MSTTQESRSQEQTSPDKHRAEDRQGKKHQVKIAMIIAATAVAVIACLLYWLHVRQFVETDDAQIDGHIYSISARINGHIARVYVEDGQIVHVGDLLAEIEPSDYRLALDRAKAEYEDAVANGVAANLAVPIVRVGSHSQIESADADIAGAQAAIRGAQKEESAADALLAEARANAKKLNTDVERYRQLIAKREISQQQFDEAVAAADSANAVVSSRDAALHAATEQVSQAEARLAQARANAANAAVSPRQVSVSLARSQSAAAQVVKAGAAMEQAQLNLGYTKIYAPVDGVVGKRTAQPGHNVQAGEDLMAIVPLHEVWVTANFKETQLGRMRPGQPVRIRVDTYGGREWNGRVAAIGGATGARFSILPPENATGNYVKVAQRVPVRIAFDGDSATSFNNDGLLRPGFSVLPKVRVR